ncbi:MAG TPA: hypothetical protein VGP68_23840 [Gemmataceae bacterium]|jgi:hypothetical protein|nr:hypothetical protein [Gemmataceae bacterium]
MKRKTLKRWVEACLVGSAIAGGCNRQEVPIAKNDSDFLPPVSAWGQKDPKALAASIKKSDNTIVPTAYTAPERPMSGVAMAMAPASALPPVVVADPPTAPTVPTPVSMVSPAPMATPPKLLPGATVAAAVPVKLGAEKPVAYADSAKGVDRYGHAQDYSWLCGEVQHTHKGWRLRYASVDETDTYGGSVTLTDDGSLSQLKEGDIFVVEGRLQDPDSHTSAPVYVVSDVKPQH